MGGLARAPGVRYPVLVPNMRGMDRAEAAGADAIAVFTAATDAFTTRQHRDDRRGVAGGLRAGPRACRRPRLVAARLRLDRVRLPVHGARGAGDRPSRSRCRLLDLGVDEVCFGDTIGVGVPAQVAALTGLAVAAGIPLERIAFHFHDTRGTALANVAAGLDAGVRCFDSSTGGTGGCPYAPGAAGNLATEDLVYFLDASGWEYGRLARRRAGRGAVHRRRARPAARDEGRPGRRLGSRPRGAATGRG